MRRLGIGFASDMGSKPCQEDGFFVMEEFNSFIASLSAYLSIDAAGVDLCMPRTFAGIYDGHAGACCMRFVRNNAHYAVAAELLRRKGDVKLALRVAIQRLEKRWLDLAKSINDFSGTTVTICVLEGNKVYTAWLGDSPAWLFDRNSRSVKRIVRDHKPQVEHESYRILRAGGQVRRKKRKQIRTGCLPPKVKRGPFRVYPGGLGIARSLGDIRSKLREYGGIPGTVIAEPDVVVTEIASSTSFLVLCTDGLGDNIKSSSSMRKALAEGFAEGLSSLYAGWKLRRSESIRSFCATSAAVTLVEKALVRSQGRRVQDNLSCIVVAFCPQDFKLANLEE